MATLSLLLPMEVVNFFDKIDYLNIFPLDIPFNSDSMENILSLKVVSSILGVQIAMGSEK